MKFLKLSICMVFAFSSTTLFADETIPTVQLLKERRPSLQLPKYSVEQKKLVLNQVRMVLNEIFVHRDLKIKDFGPATDPLPYLNEIEKNIETISDYDFHKKMAEIFFKQRDFHTSYGLPRPYSCYRSIIPVSFKEVIDLSGKKVIAVSAVTEKEELLNLMPANFQVQTGDIVLSYNGQPIRQAMQNAAPRSRGANPAAILRHTAQILTYVSQGGDVAPVNDEVILVLKDRLGRTYTNTLPWISTANQDCLKKDAPVVSGNATMGANEYQIEFNKIFRKSRNQKSSTDGDGLKDTLEPILKYKKLNNEYGSFGYFQLESFVPEKLNIDGVVLEFKKLLQTEFLHTTGIIIDLRDNGGGMISLAEKLTQLFTANYITPMNFRQKSSPSNLHYMQTVAPGASFTKALVEAAQIGAVNSRDLPMSGIESINTVGQYFFRPVVILTNSSCYSSCDMFSAQMQDHGAAAIFGEDANTGAGGANNYDLKAMYNDLPEGKKGPFRLLPNNQNIGFSFRQTVRVGLHKDELLEDVGVVADRLATPSIGDLYNFSENQFKILAGHINRAANNFPSWVGLSNDGNLEIALGENPGIFAKWAHTDSIEYKVNGKIIEVISVEEDNSTGRKLPAPESILTTDFKKGSYEMIGLYDGKRVWRKIVNFRVVPKNTTAISSEGLTFDLTEGLPSFLHIYNDNNAAENGWVVENGTLKIGKKELYADDTHTIASAFFVLPEENLKLNFEASIATEKDYDFIKVVVVSEGKETALFGTSGEVPMRAYRFDLGSFAGKKIEVRFIFDSDEGIVSQGVTLQNISIRK